MKKCKNCGKETTNPKYCSRSCAAIVSNKLFPKRQLKKKCTECDNLVKSYRHSKCTQHHETYIKTRFDYIQHTTLAEYWSRDSLKNLHASSRNAHIRVLARQHFKHLTKLPCACCGYGNHVEICHIKPIRQFGPTAKLSEVNSSDNLIQLCPNCHWEFDNGILKLESFKK